MRVSERQRALVLQTNSPVSQRGKLRYRVPNAACGPAELLGGFCALQSTADQSPFDVYLMWLRTLQSPPLPRNERRDAEAVPLTGGDGEQLNVAVDPAEPPSAAEVELGRAGKVKLCRSQEGKAEEEDGERSRTCPANLAFSATGQTWG